MLKTTAQLTNKIAQECERVSSGIITPLMQMNAKIVLVIFMSIAIFVYSPLIAMFAISLFVWHIFFDVQDCKKTFCKKWANYFI